MVNYSSQAKRMAAQAKRAAAQAAAMARQHEELTSQQLEVERALAFRIPTGHVRFMQWIDSFKRVIFAFPANSTDREGRPVFAAPTRRTAAGDLFVPEIQLPAKGASRLLFVGAANYDEHFVAFPNNKDAQGICYFVAVANAAMDSERRLRSYRQLPLNTDGIPLFVAFPSARDHFGNEIVRLRCTETDVDGAAGFASEPYAVREHFEMFFFAHATEKVDGRAFFSAAANTKFDGRLAYVARYNFVRRRGSRIRPPARKTSTGL